MNKQRLRSALTYLISLLMIAAFVYYLYINADKYLELLNVSFAGVVALFLLSLALPVLNGFQNTILYRELGTANFSYLDGIFISAISSLANQLPIPGGVISKAYYLKRKYNLSYIVFSSSTLALFFCYVALNGLIGLSVLGYWVTFDQATVSPVLLIGFGLMTTCILIFWAPLERIKTPNHVHEKLERALDGWLHINRNPLMTLEMLFLQFVMILLLSIRYWLAFHMLSQDISIGQLLLMSSASILTQVVSIAPGGLGVREGIVGAVAAILGLDAGVSVVAVGLDRLVSTFVKLLAGGVGAIVLGNQLARIAAEPQAKEKP